MAYLKMALAALKRSKLSNLLTVLQLVAALIVTAVMVSAVCLRFRKYTPFADYFNREGFLMNTAGWAEFGERVAGGELENFGSNEQISKHFSAPVEVMCPRCVPFWVNVEAKNDPKCNPQLNAYTDDFLARWTPKLRTGHWLKGDPGGDVIEAVVTCNDSEWQVGDTGELEWMELHEDGGLHTVGTSPIKIVGMLEDGEAIAGMSSVNTQDFRLFWMPFSQDREGNSIYLLFSASQLARLAQTDQFHLLFGRTMLIRYTEPVTEEQIETDYKMLARQGNAAYLMKMSEVRENSKSYLYTEVYKLLPVVIMLTMLVAVSSISATAISTRKRLHDYAVCSLNGLPWGRCIIINLLQSLLTAILAGILASAGVFVLQYTPLKESFYVTVGIWQILCCGGLILVYLLISLLMPKIMLSRNSVREILKTQ